MHQAASDDTKHMRARAAEDAQVALSLGHDDARCSKDDARCSKDDARCSKDDAHCSKDNAQGGSRHDAQNLGSG